MKKLLPILLMAILAFSVAATGSASAKVKIRVWNFYVKDSQNAFNQILQDYNNSQDKVEVVSEYIPFAEIKKQLSIGVVSNELPELVVVDNPDHAAFAAMGVFEDITTRVKKWGQISQFFKGPVQSATYNGKNYGLPLYSNCLALFYNETMLKEAGVKPPLTFEQVQAAAKKLTTKDHYGLAVSAVKSEEGTFQFLPWILAAGGSFTSLDSRQSIHALQFWTDLVKSGTMSREVINWAQPDVEKQFVAGKTAMMINGPWQIANLKTEAPDLKWNVTFFPSDKKRASVLGGSNIAIVKGKQVDESFKFMTYLCSQEVMEKWARLTGYLPSRSDAAKMDMLQKDPIFKLFMDQMATAQPRGPHPKWPEFSGAIQIAVQEALTEVKTPEQAMKDAAKKVNYLLK